MWLGVGRITPQNGVIGTPYATLCASMDVAKSPKTYQTLTCLKELPETRSGIKKLKVHRTLCSVDVRPMVALHMEVEANLPPK